MTDASKGLVGFCVLVVVVLSTGCDFLPVGEPNSEVGPIAKPTVYQVGTFEGALADEMAEFLNLVPYDGSRTDAPVVIAGNAVAGLTLAEAAGIKGIYDAQHPVAVVYASLAQIEALQQNVLGNASFQYAFPADVTVADIYGIDKEQDGDMWQWSLFPPASAATSFSLMTETDRNTGQTETTEFPTEAVGATEDTGARQDSRAQGFIAWLAEDGVRWNTPLAQSARQQSAQAANGNNLTDLAAAFVDQGNFQQEGNNYQISHFVYKCHSLDADPSKAFDWFYVQQYGVFSGSAAYTIKEGMNKGWYLDQIEMNTSMSGFENNPAAVGMIQSSPQTVNGQTTVTSGVSFTIGGEVGVAAGGPSGKLSAGISISNSTTITIRDCDALNKSNDQGNNAHWLYSFKRCQGGGVGDCFFQNCVLDPPQLAVTTFQPMNQWIWKMTPAVRAQNAPMYTSCYVQLCRSEEKWYFFYYELWQNFKGTSWARNIYIPFPPTTAQ